MGSRSIEAAAAEICGDSVKHPVACSRSIEAAAAEICGDSVKHPVAWVMRRIRTGQIRAYKVGHTWRMSEQDIKDAIASLYNTGNTASADQAWERTTITPASLNRRRTS
jgi:hypothetical protein